MAKDKLEIKILDVKEEIKDEFDKKFSNIYTILTMGFIILLVMVVGILVDVYISRINSQQQVIGQNKEEYQNIKKLLEDIKEYTSRDIQNQATIKKR